MELYVEGRRSISVQVRFGIGVFRHLLRHGRSYDVVQTPGLHVSLLAVLAARLFRRFELVVDWWEVWTREYWSEYLGGLAGRVGWLRPRLARPAAEGSEPAPGALFLPLARAAARGARAPRFDHDRRRALGAAGRGTGDVARRAAGGLRGEAHPREAGAGDRAGGGRGARADPGAARGDLRRRPRPGRGPASDRGPEPRRSGRGARLRHG